MCENPICRMCRSEVCPLCGNRFMDSTDLIIHLGEDHHLGPKCGKTIREQIEMSPAERVGWIYEMLDSIYTKNYNRKLEGEDYHFSEDDMHKLSIALAECRRIGEGFEEADSDG